jgi:hypothetical protein
MTSKSTKRAVSYTKVSFCVEHKLQSYETLGIVGSHRNLGKWDSKKAALAQMVGDDGQWKVEVKLPSRQVAYYKWAVFHRETMELICWEERGNRAFATTPDTYEMIMSCVFGGGESVQSHIIGGKTDEVTAVFSYEPSFITEQNRGKPLPKGSSSKAKEECLVESSVAGPLDESRTEVEMELPSSSNSGSDHMTQAVGSRR